MIWFIILLVILAIGSTIYGMYSTFKEAERLIEEEKLEENGQEQHDTRTGGETD